jgi:hypothetical protein
MDDVTTMTLEDMRAEYEELQKHVVFYPGTKQRTFDNGTPEGFERHNRNYYLRKELNKRERALANSPFSAENVAFNKQATALGYRVGDKVKRYAQSMLGPIGGSLTVFGTIVMREGRMTVKCNNQVPTTCNGRVTYRTYVPLTKDWIEVD